MFNEIVIQEIIGLNTVSLAKGSSVNIVNRKCFGLSFSIEGHLIFEHDGKAYVSDPGHAVLLPQGASYCHTALRDGIYPVINFACEGIEAKFVSIPVKTVKPLWAAYQRMKQLQNDTQSRLLLLAMLYELFHMLQRDTVENRGVQKFTACIRDHLQDPMLNNHMLANMLHVSESYFRKKFLQAVGMSPRQYILQERLEQGKRMLSEGRMSVKTVAEACGFASVYHFSRAFHQRIGMSPTEYAQKYRVFEI